MQDGEAIRLSDDLRPRLEAAIVAAIDDGSLRWAIDELLSLTSHLETRGAAPAAQGLMELLHGLVSRLEVEKLTRGSKGLERTEARASAEALLGTPTASRSSKLGQKAAKPWWSVRAENDPAGEDE